ncbi:TetR/AcrR family transcriptional regulator [Silvibacterium dinghuense]|uniref:TetR/AcrR family transcriptional regulator n=1 Tax=Silvibacterium dinghuense TaxID=1560006 RepID=A0A4Q1S9T0_9BACT|nr:TetR/AcrR family transcriptional regulator [Silvibacterium dinghuense]RXS93436.1 TetR/AcrR family transcriptional regulator [Silvibacterium dinghuense]GGH05774.1 TetR family transcriptional regulator [Silvibacterium dinghuense]
MKKGEITRQRIIELAAPLFNQRGYAGCSMADIMEATGLEKGGIYRYFESKEALAAEAFLFSQRAVRKLRTDDLQKIPGALEKLRYLMDRFVSEPSSIQGGCPLMNTAVDSDDGNAILRDLVHQAFTDWRSRIAAIIRKGIRDGEIQESCRPAELADTLIAALEGALLMSRLDGTGTALQHARNSMDVLLDVYTRK